MSEKADALQKVNELMDWLHERGWEPGNEGVTLALMEGAARSAYVAGVRPHDFGVVAVHLLAAFYGIKVEVVTAERGRNV